MAKPRNKPVSSHRRDRGKRRRRGGRAKQRRAEWLELVRNRWSFWVVVVAILLSLSTYAVLRVSKPVVLRDGATAAQLPPLLDLDDLVFSLGSDLPRPYLDLLVPDISAPHLNDAKLAFEPATLRAEWATAQPPLPSKLESSKVRFPEPKGEWLLAAGFAESSRPQDFALSQQMQENPLETAYFGGLPGRSHDSGAVDPSNPSSQQEPCEGEDCEDENDANRTRPMNDRDSLRPTENATVPEPGSLPLLLSGLAALGAWRLGRRGRPE